MAQFARPLRAVVAVLIAVVGLSAAIATEQAETDNALPASFTPAQPVAGETVEFHFVRMLGDEVIAGPLSSLRRVSSGYEWTHDATGVPTLVEVLTEQPGGYVKADTEKSSYNPNDDVTPMPWSWAQPLVTANDLDGKLVWLGGREHETTTEDTATLLVVPAVQTREEFREGRLYRDRNTTLQSDCPLMQLPAQVSMTQPLELPGTCVFLNPFIDERHPDFTTGQALHDRPAVTTGLYAHNPEFLAWATMESEHGRGVVFRYTDAYDLGWDIKMAYVEHIPYPVWVEINNPDTPTRDVIFLTQYEAEPPTTPQQNLSNLTPLTWKATKPWGLDDAGISLPILPSEAWAAALEPELDGTPSELANFLAAHDDAFTEMVRSDYAYVNNGIEAAQERYRWIFQVRGGDERIRFTVQQAPKPLTQAPEESNLGAYDVDSVGVWVPTWDLQAAPETAPSMVSLARQFREITGQPDPVFWSIMPACNNRFYSDPCEGGLGWTPMASSTSLEESQQLNTDGPYLERTGTYLGNWVDWMVDGRLDSTVAAQTNGKFTTNTESTALTEPATVTPVVPAPAWGRGTAIGIGSATLLAALAVYFWPAIKAGPLALFSRIRRDAVLENPTRARLAEAIQAEPGIHFQELTRRVDLGHGAAEHHLRKLVETRQVVRKEAGGYTCYFPHGTDRHTMAAAPALRSQTARDILAAIQQSPGATAAAVATATGVARSSVAHHARRLIDANVIESRREGRNVQYFASSATVMAS